MAGRNKHKITGSERLWRITVTVLGAVFLWCIITFLVTPLFMAHPHRNKDAEAQIESSSQVKAFSIQGAHELSGYLLDDPDSDTLIIYFYGISDDAASSMLEFLDIRASGSAFNNVDLAVADWPSYGKSKGLFSDDSMRESACEIVHFFSGQNAASEDYSCSRIVIMGYSLGTGPAVYAASKCGCDDLILISPYYSSTDLYNNVTPIFYGPLRNVLGFNMESYKYASDVSLSPLVIASSSDRRVPLKSTENLCTCFPAGCDLKVFSGIEHGVIPSAPEVLQLINERLSS